MQHLFVFLIASALVASVIAFKGQENVRLVGRFNVLGQSNWPMAGLETFVPAFNDSTSVIVEFDQCTNNDSSYPSGCGCNYFVTSVVNGVSTGITNIKPDATSLSITVPASNKESKVEVYKITEASYHPACGVMSIKSVSSSSQAARGLQLSKSNSASSSKIKLQVFGDSLTCGYGALGVNPCDYSPETESAYTSWASVLAKAIDADLSQVTWSGKGVVRNYGDANQMSQYPLPFYYNRTLGLYETDKGFSGDDLYWDASQYQADIVLVLLGSNDYSTNPVPESAEFIHGYTALVQQIKKDYPRSKIVLLCSPDQETTMKCPNVATTAIQNAVYFLQIGATPNWTGCSGHPDQDQQRFMAETYVIPYIKALLLS